MYRHKVLGVFVATEATASFLFYL